MLDLDTVDTDGAIRETQDEALTRSSAMKKAAIFGGGLFGGATLLGLLSPRRSRRAAGCPRATWRSSTTRSPSSTSRPSSTRWPRRTPG